MTAEERVTMTGACPNEACDRILEWSGTRAEHGHGTTYRFATTCPRCVQQWGIDTTAANGSSG